MQALRLLGLARVLGQRGYGEPVAGIRASQTPRAFRGIRLPKYGISKITVRAAQTQAPSNPAKSAGDKSIARERVLCIRGLQGDDIRHSLDQTNTSLLRAIPGIELVARSLLGPIAEQVLLLENIATSIQIGPEQLPSVHKLLVEAAQVLELEAPELYVRQNPVPNAYTLAIAGRKPFIMIHTALLELLTPSELQAVLAHELGHLKCDHGVWLTAANTVAGGTVSVLPLLSGVMEDALMRWLRAAELTCDRAALLVAQDPKVVVSALMKLAGGSPSFAAELNVDAFLQQARAYDDASNSMFGWYIRNAQTRSLTHPLPVMRAREIDRWAHSTQYKALLARGRASWHSPAAIPATAGGGAVTGGGGAGSAAAAASAAAATHGGSQAAAEGGAVGVGSGAHRQGGSGHGPTASGGGGGGGGQGAGGDVQVTSAATWGIPREIMGTRQR